jgi:hypothetical protein
LGIGWVCNITPSQYPIASDSNTRKNSPTQNILLSFDEKSKSSKIFAYLRKKAEINEMPAYGGWGRDVRK